MPEINQHITISKNLSSQDDLDFEFLRLEGIKHIEQLGSRLWTDFNTHDPGITILEVLCYAITDLGNRINLPVEDLMTRKEGDDFEGQFFKATQILPTAAVTALDYRKLMIDIKGVKNCWIKKEEINLYADLKQQKLSYNEEDFKDTLDSLKSQFQLKGLYKFLIETEDGENDLSEELKKNIFKTYNTNRNLCEDLVKVEAVQTHPISICANVEVLPEADEELVHAKILIALEDYLSPSPHFYSLKEMMEKGYATEEIFEGPLLNHGFIDLKELKNSELRKEVRLSDVINIIMGIQGVKLVKEITIGNCEDDEEESEDVWIICIPENKKPKLCKKTVINYFKGILPINLNQKKALAYKRDILDEKFKKEALAGKNKEPELPQGNLGDWGIYDSIQHDFPETYGLSNAGLPDQLGIERKIKARQLKGYLLFFDQILGSYFKHLDKVKDLFSLNSGTQATYFTQAIKDIKEIDLLVKNYPEDENQLSDQLMQFLDDAVKRKNQLMDHLIARFAEQFGNYAFLMKMLYGESSDEIVLQNKQEFLREYDQISRERGEAFNYYEQKKEALWNTENVSGTQKRISRLAGIKNYKRRNISEGYVEIYKHENVNGKWVYRWRIRDEQKKTFLSANISYPSYNAAGNEMYFSILKILETKEGEIEQLMDKSFGSEITVGSFHIHQTASSGKFSFDVINAQIASENDPDFIIAKQFKYYSSREKVLEAILSLIHFIKRKFTEANIYLVEHILLRPNQMDPEFFEKYKEEGKEFTIGDFMPFCTEDFELCKNVDPYSYRVSIILPGYTYRFANKDFRDYLENLIREELPSHVVAKICWIGYRKGEEPEIPQFDVENPDKPIFKGNQLVRFEKAYQNFLLELTDFHQRKDNPEAAKDYNEILNEFIASITGLHTIYPGGRLYDCEEEDEDLDGKLILGKTNLGTL